MRPIQLTITALAGTVTAGLLVTQTPTLTAVGNDDYGKREEDTPSVHLVDDEDDNETGRDTGKDTGKDTGTPSRATRDGSRADVTRNSRVSRDDRSDDRSADHSND